MLWYLEYLQHQIFNDELLKEYRVDEEEDLHEAIAQEGEEDQLLPPGTVRPGTCYGFHVKGSV